MFTGTPKRLEDGVKNLVNTRLKSEPDLQKKLNSYIAKEHFGLIDSDDQAPLFEQNLKTLGFVLENISKPDVVNLNTFAQENPISSEMITMLAARIAERKDQWDDEFTPNSTSPKAATLIVEEPEE
ncbi:hypothetical protein A3J41_00545 [candidate division TM6 bacterium RIFCSPHIGHO2_12_FULL_38_8]|nr:MAG: hypothetical protein A3J41_00545 [candidate division TM6 bacterium RIFCSPHIGHO2_12_FULL_38_8]